MSPNKENMSHILSVYRHTQLYNTSVWQYTIYIYVCDWQHNLVVSAYSKKENVLTAMFQNCHFDIHSKFPLISLNAQITYTMIVHFNGKFKHCYYCLIFTGWCSEETTFYKISTYPCLCILHLKLHYNEHVSNHINWLLKIAKHHLKYNLNTIFYYQIWKLH
jgi:hypothetical protein